MNVSTQIAKSTTPAPIASLNIDNQAEAELRRAPRKAMRLPATIKIENVHDSLTCVVTEFSATGARVQLTEYDRIPFTGPARHMGQVTLYMPLDRIVVVCQAMWRNKSELGLKFLTAMQHCGR